MAWSGLWVRRLARNWRRPLRPMASPFPAGMEALMTDANLQLFACAAQQFGLVDDGNAERAGLLQFGPGIRPHHHGRRFLGNVVGDVPPAASISSCALVRDSDGRVPVMT